MRKAFYFCFSTLFLTLLPAIILTACGQGIGEPLDSTIWISPSSTDIEGTQATLTPMISATFNKTGTPIDTPAQPILATTSTPEIPPATAIETPTETAVSFSYVFPVQPPALASFAEGVASHGYPATDIFAPEGTKFVAVISGVVDFVSYQDTWDPKTDDPATRGGLSVAIIGDDGVRYYGSHLSKILAGIRPGIRVAAGELLGYIGHTGDARNTDSHLHFGISRPSFPEDWKARRGQVDPYAYLFAWRSGLDLTPGLPSP